MWAVHALCTADGRLVVWAEDSGLPARIPGRAPRGPLAHPFAAAGEALRDAFGEQSKIDSVRIQLPSYASAPAPSPELVRDPLTAGPAPRGKLRVREWLVPAVSCNPATVLELLDEDMPGCRLGTSARFLRGLAEWAEQLVSGGRVLPALVDVDEWPTARWRPALSSTDSAHFVALRDAMPPAFRCERGDAPADVLRTALNSLVDGIVRSRVADLELTSGRTAAATWLRALTGEPRFDSAEGQVRKLARQLDTWRASGGGQNPVRTCFRLHAPEDDEDWRLEFLLQAVDDPSVLVSANEVWRADSRVLQRWVDEPEELLLTDLGAAGRIFPALDAALRVPHPSELLLDADGAYEFLTSATLLDQAGFGVLLPSWWGRQEELGLKLTATSTGTAGAVTKESGVGLADLVDYRWDLALGNEQLTASELDELAAAKVPLVRLRGRWVRIDRKRLAAGLAFLERSGTGQMTAGEVLLQAGLPAEDAERPMPVVQVSGRGWVGDLLSGQLEQHLEPVEPPEQFNAVLRPYQRRGLAWLAFLDRLGLGACLADDMGLGKTVQLLALEALVRAEGPRTPTLLVCPMSLVGNWQREAARFAPTLKVHVHHGSDRLTGEDLMEEVGGHDLVITTYPLAARDSAVLREVRWDRVVLDEAQNIKNSNSRQARAVRGLSARQRIALTGTPVENRLAELWSIMDFANPGALGSLSTFRARFAVPIERDGDTEAAARLRRVTGPFVLRRLKTDPAIIDDLPDKIEMKQLCNLTAEQASLYQAVVDDMLARIADSEGMERRGLVLATMSKLKQVCNHPAQLLGDGSPLPDRSGKLARLEEILESVLAEGDKALCFTQFAGFAGMLVPHLAARFDTEVLLLHGGTPKRARDEMVRRFQESDGPSIFLLSLKAGGTGLTLTAANHVIHLDRWWNPAVEDQATDRAFRIGQRRDVQVRKLTCIGTLEEKIDRMMADKKALAQLVVGSGENWLTELSTSQLRELVALEAEAVGG
ncbi:Superfamily II DNA or RNA helicase, SNF2 family [Saccharopolyspora antimicrobica]|uniref:SNF2 family DNA or RNA helicase n=1 Tax=Saccharopolyspora antimicrobica TaxID=455193 RepID=A0A1I4Y672_9PSEU|nr:DEAD/DEAH box helicase [Saccharopolyspora antimicrobica]RKT82542.1 SNF2 family DNA or RNA helicase [Saccharopolyspora antimicrobica]SFN33572.1 Superfamily II DNA or RNA helicase, SNF2 family [Saccharopolyspora antimicrobica]